MDAIQIDFKNKVPDAVIIVHWDGKLLPALDAISVPKLDNSTGKEQSQAVWKAILDWNLEDKVHILCYDTMVFEYRSY